jgi:hypothetical protein
MKRFGRWIPVVVLAVLLVPVIARSQAPKAEADMPQVTVAIYHVAPGKHLDFLKWMAANEGYAKEAGVPAGVFYAHVNGDSWDYLQITPELTDEQSAKLDAVTKKHGGKIGVAGSLEFRTFVSSHTDTTAVGPVSAADLVASAGM